MARPCRPRVENRRDPTCRPLIRFFRIDFPAQATLTAALSNPEIAADPDKFREATHAVATITIKLENSYSRWGDLSDEIEKVKAKLEIEA